MPLYGCVLKRAEGLIKLFNNLIKLSESLMKRATSLIKLSARNQEPRTKIPRKVLLRILVPGTWGGNQDSQQNFPGDLGSWFLANSLIKLLDDLITVSNSLIKLSARNQEPRTKIPRKVLLRILVPGTWVED